MYTLKIKVTKEILEKTKKCRSSMDSCAIAEAVRTIFPKALVGFRQIIPFPTSSTVNLFSKDWVKLVTDKPKNNYIELPENAIMFIKTFDQCSEDKIINLPECEFEVEIQDEIIQRINIDEIKPLLENHPTLELLTV